MRFTLITTTGSLLLLAAPFTIALGQSYKSNSNSAYPTPAQSSENQQFAARDETGLHRASPAPSATPQQQAVQQQPFHLGEAIFNGTYRLKKSDGTHVAEKAHRLGILRTGLTPAEQQHFDPARLASALSDREMNALEYYIKVKEGRFVTTTPSWAKKEPPIKAE